MFPLWIFIVLSCLPFCSLIVTPGDGNAGGSQGVCPVQTAWDYRKQNSWPGWCQYGQRQSPITIYVADTTPKKTKRIIYGYYYRRYEASLTNTGHSVELRLSEFEEPPTIWRDSAHRSYIFDHAVFRWSSEHTINGTKFGTRYPLELQLVHYSNQFKSLDDAYYKANAAIVILSVFYNTAQYNPAFDTLVNSMNEIKCTVNEPVKLQKVIRLIDFLPSDQQNYFEYQGSFTEPDCWQSVTWVVFETVSSVGISQIIKLTEIGNKNANAVRSNYRNIQELYGREVSHHTPL